MFLRVLLILLPLLGSAVPSFADQRAFEAAMERSNAAEADMVVKGQDEALAAFQDVRAQIVRERGQSFALFRAPAALPYWPFELGAVGIPLLELRGGSVPDLAVLANAPWLESLVIAANHAPLDLSAVETMPALQNLSLVRVSYAGLPNFAAMTSLNRFALNAFEAPIDPATLSSLADAPGLTSLHLNYLGEGPLTFLADLQGVRMLTLGNWGERDLAVLANLSSLTSLGVLGIQPKDLDFLTALPALESLSLKGMVIHDLAPVLSLRNLDYLDLGTAQVEDHTGLAALRVKYAGTDIVLYPF